MATLQQAINEASAKGGRFELLFGELKEKKSGNTTADNKPFAIATVVFLGGKETYSYDVKDLEQRAAFDLLPAPGTRVCVLAEMDADRDRKGNYNVFRRAPLVFPLTAAAPVIPAAPAAGAGSMPPDLAARMAERAAAEAARAGRAAG